MTLEPTIRQIDYYRARDLLRRTLAAYFGARGQDERRRVLKRRIHRLRAKMMRLVAEEMEAV